MIQSAHDRPISEIFGIDARVNYIIPKFQREYVWGKDQWENFFNDLAENDKGHFLGSMICINKGTDALDIVPLEIVDGQQRLTTVSLLYAAIYSELSGKRSEDEEIKNERYNLKSRLLQKGKKDEPKLRLSEQKHNDQDYKTILKDLNLLQGVFSKIAKIGQRRIYKAYQYFRKRLEGRDIADLLGLIERVNSALLVKIEVKNDSDAFLLFESLNNRGIPLSAVDLIKNKILAQLEKKNIKPINEAFAEWVGLVNNLPDYTIQERFLRQYYNAFKHKDSVGIQNISKATKSNLIRIYDTLISRDTATVFTELVGKSDIYNQFVEPESCEEADFKRGLRDLQNVGAAPSYTFLLYLFSEHTNEAIIFSGVVNLLVKYFVRRSITDYPATRDLDTIFINLVEVCEKGPMTMDMITTFLTAPKRFSQLDRFAERLQGNIYEENTDTARFILTQIEESRATRETAKDLWARDQRGRLVWSIEHIFPEGERIPKEWITMIANGDADKAETLRAEYTHRLGNLTLSAYNSKLFNYAFEKKRDLKDNRGEHIGYKNGLYLNQYLKDRSVWTIDDITRRTKNLASEAVSIFKLPSESVGELIA